MRTKSGQKRKKGLPFKKTAEKHQNKEEERARGGLKNKNQVPPITREQGGDATTVGRVWDSRGLMPRGKRKGHAVPTKSKNEENARQ